MHAILRKSLGSLAPLAFIALSTPVAASPAVAPYLEEHGRSAPETAASPWFVPDSIRTEGSGFVIYAGGGVYGESMSIHADHALNVTAIERPAPFATVCPKLEIGEFGQDTVILQCDEVAVDAQRSMFYIDTIGDTRVAVARDREQHSTALGFDARLHGVATIVATDGGAISAIATTSGQLRLLSVDAQAHLRWQVVVDAFSADGVLRWVRNGDRLLLLRQQGSDLRIDRVEPSNGTMTLQLQRTLDEGLRLGAASLDSAANLFLWLYLPDSGGTEGRIQRMNASGTVTLAQDVHCISGAPEYGFSEGFAANCGLSSNGVHTHWYSFDTDGRHLYKVAGSAAPRDAWSTIEDIAALGLAADGSSLLGVHGAYSLSGAASRLVRVGSAVDEVTDPAVLTPTPEVALKPSVHDAGPSGFVVADSDTFNMRLLRRFSADGQQLWRAPLQPGRGLVNVSATQVCAFSGGAYHIALPAPTHASPVQTLVDCVRLADGTPTLSAQMDDVRDGANAFAAHTPGRALAFVYPVPSADNLTRLVEWRDGAAARTLASDYVYPLAVLDSTDRVVVFERDSAPVRLDRFDAAGTAAAPLHLPAAVVTLADAAFDDQDRLWIIYSGNDPDTYRLARVDAQGQFADSAQSVVPGRQIARVVTSAFGTLVQVDRYESPYFDGSPDSTLLSLANDGQPRWQYFARSAWPHFAAIDSGPTRIGVLELAAFPTPAWRLTELDSNSGAVQANHPLPLPNLAYRAFPRVKFAAADRIDFAGDAGTHVSVGSVGVSPGAMFGEIASALGGAWAIPGLGGQGLAIEYNPAVAMLSAAWYSHETDSPESFEHSALRWHTMLGLVPQSETFEMPLSIFNNVGGAFDDVPTTASNGVGSATLSVTDCDHMTLSYAFGDDQTAPKLIALQRASPRTKPCTLRSPNSTQTITTPARYAAQSDLGGAWYEQRTSGQGMHLVVYPPSSPAAPETLGLGWFTYDPSGNADDATQQHWFTGLGSFDDAAQQRATLTIYRTTGGDRAYAATRNTHRVGTATLQRIDCDSATLNYRFDDTLVAASFAARARTIPLQRLGGCQP